jgi:hypothetical protein
MFSGHILDCSKTLLERRITGMLLVSCRIVGCVEDVASESGSDGEHWFLRIASQRHLLTTVICRFAIAVGYGSGRGENVASNPHRV